MMVPSRHAGLPPLLSVLIFKFIPGECSVCVQQCFTIIGVLLLVALIHPPPCPPPSAAVLTRHRRCRHCFEGGVCAKSRPPLWIPSFTLPSFFLSIWFGLVCFFYVFYHHSTNVRPTVDCVNGNIAKVSPSFAAGWKGQRQWQ